MASYYPSNDNQLIVWITNFTTVANANLATLGLVAADLTAISTQQATLATNVNDVESKKAALSAAVDTKDATKELLLQKVKATVNKIQANPAITIAMKSQLGISTNEGGKYPQHPATPTNLVAELIPDTGIELDWSRNGNSPTTQFVIEYRLLPSTAWQLLDIITKTNYMHSGLTIGAGIEYRVKARKGTETSGPCNIAIIHPGTDLSGLV